MDSADCVRNYKSQANVERAFRSLTDVDQEAKLTRDPAAQAKRSASPPTKAQKKRPDDDTPVHSFSTLMAEFDGVARNTCRIPGAAPDTLPFDVTTTANPKQARALELISAITM